VSARAARPRQLAGEGPAARLERLQPWLAERELDALLVTGLHDIRYLAGFTGSNGLVLAVADAARERLGGDRFFTDFRYQTQSAEQVPGVYAREIAGGELLDAAAAALGPPSPQGVAGGGRLGFDPTQLSVRAHARLVERLPQGWQAVAAEGGVRALRAVKEPAEVEKIRLASELADAALLQVLDRGLAGRTEREVAIELELAMRQLGAEAASFPSIVAAGAHAALPHAQPRGEPIPRDVLVTIDWGALNDGYCSDCTRTYATGERLPARAREIYELVLAAQRAGVEAVRAGHTGRAVDAVARAVIEEGGKGERFGHGLGHGVGLEVHEPPRLSRTEGEHMLLDGNVVTVEPGVYLPGELGVRIEDLVVVRDGGHEVLTSLPKELTVVS
jgi:Xaa-Pro aminopeptidase